MATIKDISRKAAVSTASVSKVLNGNYDGVSETTKDLILSVAKELKYRPNRFARGLVKKSSGIIGLIVPDIANPYYASLSKGVEEAASQLGRNLILCNTSDDSQREYQYVNMLIEYNADAVILTSMISYNPKSDAALRDYEVPFAALDRYATSAPLSFLCNSQLGIFKATEYLIQELGHRSIAFIGGNLLNEQLEGSEQRRIGYQGALKAADLPLNPALVKNGSYSIETGYSCGMELLESGERFTAVVCANDLIAIGVIKALKKCGKRIPQDVSVTGYDDIPLASVVEPNLTTMRQDAYSIGRRLCLACLSFEQETTSDRMVCHIEPELVLRDSTGPAPASGHS